ncbi:MAG: Gfo/Idh/MocA family oxidoreductase, partial [Candidatus Poribacteria bacterium]|nr:Gfo/Idh/MocA family oxidoreductase [Candidatus Poribacteria bacterium]
MSNRPIILIGAGGIVESAHLPAYQKAGLKVIGITDLDQQKARNIAKKFNVPNVYDSVHQATIHAPEHTIFDIAIPASGLVDLLPTFRNGSTLLIQKPMGENIKQAQQIKQICRQKNFTANVNFQLRFAPQVTEARKMISRGTIGKLHDIEMRVTVYTPWHLWDFLEKCDRVEILYHSIHY